MHLKIGLVLSFKLVQCRSWAWSDMQDYWSLSAGKCLHWWTGYFSNRVNVAAGGMACSKTKVKTSQMLFSTEKQQDESRTRGRQSWLLSYWVYFHKHLWKECNRPLLEPLKLSNSNVWPRIHLLQTIVTMTHHMLHWSNVYSFPTLLFLQYQQVRGTRK